MTAHVALLLTDPERASLDGSILDAARRRLGGGAARWLCQGAAAEFELDGMPSGVPDIAAEFRQRGIDLIALPAEGRRKRLLVADMDSTIIRQECIDELAAEAGCGAEVAAITARAMNGEIDFVQALRDRVALLAGTESSIIERVWTDRIAIVPGAGELVATMNANGASCALVSGGFADFTARVADRLGFGFHRANALLAENGTLTGKIGEPPLGGDAKPAIMSQLLAEAGLAAGDAIAVGDGSNDIPMLKMAGIGAAFRPKPAVAAEIPIQICHGDLTGLLYIQGYFRGEFASLARS